MPRKQQPIAQNIKKRIAKSYHSRERANDSDDAASVSPQVKVLKKSKATTNKQPRNPRRPLNPISAAVSRKPQNKTDGWLINARHADDEWW